MIEKIAKEIMTMSVEELNGVSRYQLQHNAEQLYHMHELMKFANYEAIYMNWIYLFPDNPSVYDFIEVASDKDMFQSCYDLFIRLICHKDYL